MGLNFKTFIFIAGAVAVASALVVIGNQVINKAKILPPAPSTNGK